jgi:SAM-dependent methyltransferase
MSSHILPTPAVLLLAWRRPHTTRQVIDAIRPAAPQRLYVACDGPNPNRPEEAEKVAATRAVIEAAVDWPCQVERLYSEHNQGCRLGVSGAISWFFEQEEEGIILEDDIVVHPDFFPYCAELLEHYRHDTRVWAISGDNFQDGQWRGNGSYYFSHLPHCWGWASWRRAWQHYDAELSSWPAFRDSGGLIHLFPNSAERRFWASIWERLHRQNQPDTWDYQWIYTVMANGGLAALPNVNLASNIGFDGDGTHTFNPEARIARIPTAPLGELLHPAHVLRHSEADDYFVHQHLAPETPAMSSAIPLPDPTNPRPRLQVALNEGERLAVDIGCGGNPRNPFNAERLIGLDVMTNQEGVYPCVIGYEPLPLHDSSVDFISAFDFIEHLPRTAVVNCQLLNPFIDTMSEIWRVLKPGGLFFAQTPAYPSMAAFVDPTHVNVITEGTVSYFARRQGLDGSAVDPWGLDLGHQYGFRGEFLLVNQWWAGTHLCWKLQCVKGEA